MRGDKVSRLVWGAVSDRLFESGTDRGVLYVDGMDGVPWNGLVGVAEGVEGGEITPFYLDGNVYMNLQSAERFKGTITAFYSPEEFDECDGMKTLAKGFFATGQRRKRFGLSYRTGIGSELEQTEYGYKIHLIYNAMAEINNRSYSTINNTASAQNLSWSILANPVYVSGVRPTAHFIIDSSRTFPEELAVIEDILYGTDTSEPRIPSVSELVTILEGHYTMSVVDNGNGTFTITGPSDMISMIDGTTFQIDSPSAIPIDDSSYTVGSI